MHKHRTQQRMHGIRRCPIKLKTSYPICRRRCRRSWLIRQLYVYLPLFTCYASKQYHFVNAQHFNSRIATEWIRRTSIFES